MALAPEWSRPLTDEDLWAMPDDGRRHELIEGVLVVTPAPVPLHQIVVGRLIVLLAAAAGDDLEVLPAPLDYRVHFRTVLQPDVLVVRRADLGPARLERTPLLVVEVQSPSTRLIDLGTKRLAFEAAGVPAYWLVDPGEPSLTALRLDEGRYVEEAHVVGEEVYEATAPVAARVVPAELVR
jgi:Uma2 family endonuclease